jgi:hypothetical protein
MLDGLWAPCMCAWAVGLLYGLCIIPLDHVSCFVDTWLSHVMVNKTSGHKSKYEKKLKTCKCLTEQ